MKPFVYFTLGYKYNEVKKFIKNSDGVYAFEFGFPTENPLYDGKKIKATHSFAVNKFSHDDNAEIFKLAESMGIKKYALLYYSVFSGKKGILDYLSSSRFDGVMVPDVGIDYPDRIEQVAKAIADHGMDYVPFVTPVTPFKIMERQMKVSGEIVYQGMMPATGIQLPYDIGTIYGHIRDFTSGKRIVYGFGIRNKCTIAKIAKYGGFGIAVGTAVVEMLDDGNVKAYRQLINDILGAS